MVQLNGAEQLLIRLYSSGSPFLDEYPWEFEGDRWIELLVCCLVVQSGANATAAREALAKLRERDFLAPETLASASRTVHLSLKTAFTKLRVSPQRAAKVTSQIAALAGVVNRRYSGYLQKILRSHGEKMTNELTAVLRSAGLKKTAARKVAVLWLQNVANVPILLPRDPYIESFCKAHSLSPKQLVDTADRLGLNVAVLDDLLALEATAAAESEKKHLRSKRRRGGNGHQEE